MTVTAEREDTSLFRALVRQLDDQRCDPEVLASKVLEQMLTMCKVELREVLYPLVLNAVTDLRRDKARQTERQPLAPPEDVIACDPTKGVKSILAMSFFSPARKDMVRWADATIEDHESRAQYLRRMAAGTIRTAEMHERASEICRGRRVSCLGEIRGFDPRELQS